MKSGIIAVIIILIVVVLAAVFLLNTGPAGKKEIGEKPKTTEEKVETGVGVETEEAVETGVKEVEITSSGFSPNSLTISQGEIVSFTNKDSSSHWPASAIHPTHKVYPGSGIEKCGTADESNIFDACRGLSQGESYSFTFNEKGSWNYHDHLSPSLKGTIIVG